MVHSFQIMIITSDGTDTLTKRIMRERQDRFLAAYGDAGTVRDAAKAAGIHRDTAYSWYESNALDFQHRMDNARLDFGEKCESVLFHDIFGPKPNPILVIFTNKAHNRAKYGDALNVTNDKAAELLSAVRALPSAGPVVEGGEVVEVGESVRRALAR